MVALLAFSLMEALATGDTLLLILWVAAFVFATIAVILLVVELVR
jgi:hypothetical protein